MIARLMLLLAFSGSLAILLLMGCGDKQAPQPIKQEIVPNDFGQFCAEVPLNEWKQWVADHKSSKIICFTSVCKNQERYSNNSITTYILVLYEEDRTKFVKREIEVEKR